MELKTLELQPNNKRKTSGYRRELCAIAKKGSMILSRKLIKSYIASVLIGNSITNEKEYRIETKYLKTGGRTIWESGYDGTYIKAIHGDIGVKTEVIIIKHHKYNYDRKYKQWELKFKYHK